MNPPLNNAIGTTSVKVLPERGLENAADWTTTENVAQGVTRANAGILYMSVDSGVCGPNAPVHNEGDASDGTVTWRRIPSKFRTGLNLVNDSDTTIFLALDHPAEANKGIRLNAAGGSWSKDDERFQGSVHAIVGAGSGKNLVSQEHGNVNRI